MDRRAIEQVQSLLRENFPGAGKDADELPARLRDPKRFGARRFFEGLHAAIYGAPRCSRARAG